MESREIFNRRIRKDRREKRTGKKKDETFNVRPLPGALSISSKS